MEKLWNSNYIKVMTANFSLFFAFYLLAPLLPIYLTDYFNVSKDTVGVVLSGYTVTALVFRPVSGYLVDSFDRKKMLLLFFFLFFVFFAGYAIAASLIVFAIIRTLHGGPFGGLTVANSTVAVDVLPSSRRNEGIGYYGLSNNIAMAVAPSVGIAIYHYTANFNLLFWLSFLVAGFGMAVDSQVKMPKKEIVKNNSALSLQSFFLVKGWLLAVNVVFFGFCFGVLQNYLAIYSKEVLGRTGGTGVFFMLLSIGLILSRLQGAKSLRKGNLTKHAAQGTVIAALGYTMFVVCRNDFGYYIAPLLIGLGNGHVWPAFMNMTINVASNRQRGTANSTLLVSWDIGLGAGILIGGVMAEYLGYDATFNFVAVMQVIGTILFFSATKQFYNKRIFKE